MSLLLGRNIHEENGGEEREGEGERGSDERVTSLVRIPSHTRVWWWSDLHAARLASTKKACVGRTVKPHESMVHNPPRGAPARAGARALPPGAFFSVRRPRARHVCVVRARACVLCCEHARARACVWTHVCVRAAARVAVSKSKKERRDTLPHQSACEPREAVQRGGRRGERSRAVEDGRSWRCTGGWDGSKRRRRGMMTRVGRGAKRWAFVVCA